jgi:hypothetical protein
LAADDALCGLDGWQRIHKVVVEGSAPLYHSHLLCRITLGRIEAASYVNQEEVRPLLPSHSSLS